MSACNLGPILKHRYTRVLSCCRWMANHSGIHVLKPPKPSNTGRHYKIAMQPQPEILYAPQHWYFSPFAKYWLNPTSCIYKSTVLYPPEKVSTEQEIPVDIVWGFLQRAPQCNLWGIGIVRTPTEDCTVYSIYMFLIVLFKMFIKSGPNGNRSNDQLCN